MSNEMRKYSATLSMIQDEIYAKNSHKNIIAEHHKAIKVEEDLENQDFRKLRIDAARFFTREMILEIHSKSVELLVCDDFNAEEYANAFLDISTVEMGHIDFLTTRLAELIELERTTNCNLQGSNYAPLDKFWGLLAEAFKKGGGNNA